MLPHLFRNSIHNTGQGFLLGSPQLPAVVDAGVRCFEGSGNQTSKWPIEVRFNTTPGVFIEDGTVDIGIGAATTTACYLIAAAAVEYNWSAKPDFHVLAPFLQKVFLLNCRFSSAGCTPEEAAYTYLGDKLTASNRSRPDPQRMWTTFSRIVESKVALGNRKPWRKIFTEAIADFNRRTKVSTCKVSSQEEKSIIWLDSQSPAVRRQISIIWGDERVANSAVTLEMLVMPCLDSCAEPPVKRETNLAWYNMLAVTETKVLMWLERCSVAFNYRVEKTKDQKKAANLPLFAAQYRDESAEVVWRTVCLWVDSLPAQKELLSAARQAELRTMFLKGQGDDVLVPKAKLMDPAYSCSELRWLREKESASVCDMTLISQGSAQEQAEQQAQVAQTKVVEATLLSERVCFQQTVAAMMDFDEHCLVAAVEAKEAMQKVLDISLGAHLEALYRVTALGREETGERSKKDDRFEYQEWFNFHEASLRTAAETQLPEGGVVLGCTYRVNIYNAAAAASVG
jgi:hypothetical protein